MNCVLFVFFLMPTTCSIECLKDDLAFFFGQLVVVLLTLHKINMFEILVCGVGYYSAIKWVETQKVPEVGSD